MCWTLFLAVARPESWYWSGHAGNVTNQSVDTALGRADVLNHDSIYRAHRLERCQIINVPSHPLCRCQMAGDPVPEVSSRTANVDIPPWLDGEGPKGANGNTLVVSQPKKQ